MRNLYFGRTVLKYLDKIPEDAIKIPFVRIYRLEETDALRLENKRVLECEVDDAIDGFCGRRPVIRFLGR